MTLQSREQRALTLGALAIIIAAGYLFLYEPLLLAREQAVNRVQSQQALLGHLQQVAKEAEMLKGRSGMVPSSRGKRSVLSAVDQSSRSSGIKSSIKRLTPEGNDRVRLWLEEVEFDRLMRWLAGVNLSDGLVVDDINISSEDEAGLVRLNLTLMKP
jgi:general secretion pathway protein M